MHNKSLVRTQTTLRFVYAAQLQRYLIEYMYIFGEAEVRVQTFSAPTDPMLCPPLHFATPLQRWVSSVFRIHIIWYVT
jgi:hypothetical protein